MSMYLSVRGITKCPYTPFNLPTFQGAIDGVYYFVDGPSHDSKEKYHWVEQKMDLSMLASEKGEESNNSDGGDKETEVEEDDYFDGFFDSDEDYDYDHSETSIEQTSEEHTSHEQISVEATSDELTNVESNKTNQSDKEQTVPKGTEYTYVKNRTLPLRMCSMTLQIHVFSSWILSFKQKVFGPFTIWVQAIPIM